MTFIYLGLMLRHVFADVFSPEVDQPLDPDRPAQPEGTYG